MTRRLALLTLLLLLTGCTSWVNIPAQRGDMAIHDPNSGTAWKVTTIALKHAMDKYPPGGNYAVIMPDGTRDETINKMLAQLPAGGGPDVVQGVDTPVFRVAGIRVRGFDAQVDIIPPAGLMPKRLFSVYLDHDLQGWFVARDHLWNMPLDKALQMARPGPRLEPIEPQPQPTEPAIPQTDEPTPKNTDTPPLEDHPATDSGTGDADPNTDDEKPVDITPTDEGVKFE